MTLRRFAIASTLPVVVAALFVGAQACSSSNDDTPSGGTCGGDPFATTGLDTVKITKAEACARYVAALQKKAESMKPSPCSLSPVPSCPEVLDKFEADTRATHPGLCVDGYSNGALTNCECRIATYTQCSDFTTKPCILGIIPAPAGTTCESDAGTDSGGADSGGDTFETSPLDDAPAADAADAGGGG